MKLLDRVDSAILKGLQLTKNLQISGKTWDDFKIAVKNRKLILYGLNELVQFLWIRRIENISIIAAIDNNIEKQQHILGELYDESDLKDAKHIKVSPKNILEEYNPDEIVVLISSYRYYEEIANELDEKGYHYCFSVLNLEYNYRKQMKKNNLHYEDKNEYVSNYVKKCVEQYPIQNNKVIISMGTYIDHGKYITKALLALNEDIDIVWVVDNPSFKAPYGVRTIYNAKTKQYIYEMETAKVWVYGTHVSSYLIKRKGQTYIQTKHWGSFLLKKVSLANKRNVSSTKDVMRLNGQWMDYIISGSEFDEETCKISFEFKGEFLRFGSPKSDILFSPRQYKEKIYKKFKIDSEEHVLMYAPTFRSNNEKNFFDFKWLGLDFDILLKALQEKWSGKWKIFLRLHPQVRTRSNLIKKTEFVIDVSEYEDSEELVAASDVLITDYSTIMVESAYIMRPVFLFAPDKDNYIKNDRELFIDYDNDLPFPISTTNEELEEQIKNFDKTDYEMKVKTFLKKYGINEDGHASERSAKFIIKLLKG